MYRRPKFLEVLHAIREQMARECDYDMDLFVQKLAQRSLNTSESNESDRPRPTPSKALPRKAPMRKRS
jgi:hypothetical protein